MRRSPLEQLDALSGRRTAEKPAAEPVAKKTDEDAIAAVHKDMAIERISNELAVLIVEGKPEIFGASISRKALEHFWEWAQRDLDVEQIAEINKTIGGQHQPDERELEIALNRIVELVTPLLEKSDNDTELKRRLTIQMGGLDVFEAVPTILLAFSYVGYIKSGLDLGQELNSQEDNEALGYALEHMEFPSNDIKSLWCQSFASKLLRADGLAATISKLSFATTEDAIKKSGFAEFVDALITNAQQQIEIIENQSGMFRDIDLTCRAIDRFHQIARGLQFHLDLAKTSKWNVALERLIKRGADSLNGKFSDILVDVNKVLRPKPSNGSEPHLDPADVLQAYNGLYILAATRTARESLAVNAIVDRVWRDVGKSLEAMVDRIFEHFKQSAGGDQFDHAQVDIAIKFCSIRFGAEYAAILRKNKDNIIKRSGGMRMPG